MTDQEKREEFERKQEEIRQKATRVCEIYAEGTPLDTSCSLEDLSLSAFFRAKRDFPDVAKAFFEAKEVLAELRVAKIDDLKEQMLAGEVDPQTFSAAVKSDQWVISRLRPDLFGTRTTVDVNGTIEHSPVKLLAKMTDEQLLQIAGAASLPAPSTLSTPSETIVEAEFDEIPVNSDELSAVHDENTVDNTSDLIYNNTVPTPSNVTSAGGDTHAENNGSAPYIAGLGVDLAALGGTKPLGDYHE